MNVRIMQVLNTTGEIIKKEYWFNDDITGQVVYIPNIIIGQELIMCDTNMRTRVMIPDIAISTETDENTGYIKVSTQNETYILKVLDTGKPKRFTANVYMETPVGRRFMEDNPDEDGHLLSGGKYKTKIYPSDLPPWYVYGRIYKRFGYISAKGVKHLLYKPNYHITNHLWKYDMLYISYDKPIISTTTERGYVDYHGWDNVVDGLLIKDFVQAAEEYSDVDVKEIKKELVKKRKWYDEHNPK